MGCWGPDSFDNDTACDWAWDLVEAKDLSFIEKPLDRVLNFGDESVDNHLAAEAIAAAETIARLKGNWGVRNSYTERMDKWVETTKLVPSHALIDKALQAIDRILTEPSDMLELWSDSKYLDEWKESVKELSDRLSA
jgi:hypothetical protein